MASKEIKTTKSDIIANRIMIVVVYTFAVLAALVFINRGMNYITDTSIRDRYIINALVVSIPSVLLAGALLYFFCAKRNRERAAARTLSPGFVLALALVLFALGIAIRLTPVKAISAAYLLVPILAVLYIVFYSYQRECFVMATAFAVVGIIDYLFYKVGNYVAMRAARLPVAIVIALLCVGYILVMRKAEKEGGLLKVGGRKIRLSSGTTGLWPHIVFGVLGAVVLVLAGAIGPMAAYYGAMVLLGFAVLAGVYYTVMLAASERR